MGYRRSKSSNALDTPKKNVTFVKNSNNLSDNVYLKDGNNTEKIKSNKQKGVIQKSISYEPSIAQKRNVGFSLKKKSFSLISLVARKNHDVTITSSSEGNSNDLGGRNEIEEKRTTTKTRNIQTNENPKTYLTKVVSPSQQSINPTKNGANIQTSSSTHLVPSLSSKVLRIKML